MPIQIMLDKLPAGISLTHALPDEQVEVCTKAYLSSEDGNDFIGHLEGVWGCFKVDMARRGISPSQIDHFLAIISREKKATLFCNELQQIAVMQAKREIEVGESVFKDDIADIEELVVQDASGKLIEIPPDHAVVLILSVGWRKCLYYDFSVFGADARIRPLDIPRLFGRFYQHLLFQEMYSIRDDQWEKMIDWGWFPFIWMGTDDRSKVINFSTRDEEPREIFEETCRQYQSLLPNRMKSWKKCGLLEEQSAFIEKAAEHYLADEYISSIQVLYPRIEGVMRRLHLLKKPGKKAKQRTMAETLVADRRDYSLLVPHRFREYVLRFYFRAFNEESGDLPLSRHTVAHGTSLPEDYDFVKASLGFMIFDQMFYYLAD